jgi:hypothetical protein
MSKASISLEVSKFPRYGVDLSAIFKTVGSIDWQVVHLRNLSLGGACVQTNADLAPEQVLEMVVETFDLSHAKHRRRLVARVVWRQENRYGLEFVRVPQKSKVAKT